MPFPIKKVRKPNNLRGTTNGKLPPELLKGIEPFGKMHALAADAWNAMRHRASLDGVYLSNVGSFRSYDSQYALFMQRYVKGDSGDSRRITRKFQGSVWMLKPGVAQAAVPGTSNHGWGLAIDSCLEVDGKRVSISSRPKGSKYATGVAWLMEHADSFGFSWELQSEPWHLRYYPGEDVPRAVQDYLKKFPNGADVVIKPSPPSQESPVAVRIEADPPWPGGRMLRVGMKNNNAVRLVQEKLGLTVDGWYGKQTKAAVMKFQRENPAAGPVDGIVGPKTWNVMFREEFPYPGSPLKIGMKNNDYVRLVQKKLGILADGWYGKQTKKAVMDFQTANPDCGPADGVVGPKTWAVLFR